MDDEKGCYGKGVDEKALDNKPQEVIPAQDVNNQEINNKSKKSNFGLGFGVGANKKEATKPTKIKYGLGN